MCTGIGEKKVGNVPVPYSQWSKVLFEGGATASYTRIINSPSAGLPRRVFGRDQNAALCFWVELDAGDETAFEAAYRTWRNAQPQPGAHTFLSDGPGHPPPNCGTSQNAPPC